MVSVIKTGHGAHGKFLLKYSYIFLQTVDILIMTKKSFIDINFQKVVADTLYIQ